MVFEAGRGWRNKRGLLLKIVEEWTRLQDKFKIFMRAKDELRLLIVIKT